LWTEKHTQGIDKLYRELSEQLKGLDSPKSMKKKLDEIGWPHGPPPRKFYEDTPKDVVQRSLAGLAMCRLLSEPFR